MFQDVDDLLPEYPKGDSVDIALIQMWDTLARQTDDAQRKWSEYEEDRMVEAETASYWRQRQPRSSWYRQTCQRLGQYMVALGRRLEARGPGTLRPQPGDGSA